ncbi:MAG: dihydrofolate reductase [Erysipelotrichaceae bacterium]|nr:dihydrofolate reductase [Erysipelotrichaceae bacterium]MDD3810361.1 dihydrofolate reductase [Erysipelotrichaceae bacterium]
MIVLIVAMDRNNLIGSQTGHFGMPWHNKEDLQHFRKTTLNHAILMGSTTFAAMKRPLKDRRNMVLTSKEIDIPGVEVIHDLGAIVDQYRNSIDTLYVCGGASVYCQTMDFADKILVSRIPGDYQGETHFPEIDLEKFVLESTTDFETFKLETYVRLK